VPVVSRTAGVRFELTGPAKGQLSSRRATNRAAEPFPRPARWAELEQNPLGIVRAQQELSHAFIETHLSEPVPHAA
jgi:hypothetical protein